MDLEFNEVTYDGDLDDADEEQLRSLVSDYEAAQDANAAEFEAAKDTLEGVEDVNVDEFHDARSGLIDEITDYDAFEASPITEDDLEAASFGKLREYDAYFADESVDDGDDADDEEDGSEFSDFGTQSPDDQDRDDTEFAERYLGDLGGINIE